MNTHHGVAEFFDPYERYFDFFVADRGSCRWAVDLFLFDWAAKRARLIDDDAPEAFGTEESPSSLP